MSTSPKKRVKPRTDYIETESGNRISRKSNLQSTSHIVLGGRSIIEQGVQLRGDLHRKDSKTPVIALGKFCILNANCSVIPPAKVSTSTGTEQETYYPVKIGAYVQVGANTTIQAASVGNWCVIGQNVTIGKFAIIKDCVKIMDNTVVPDYAVFAPFSVVQGEPATVAAQLPESCEQVFELNARQTYSGIDYYNELVDTTK